MNNIERLHRLLELESENRTLKAQVKDLKRTISQCEQPVAKIEIDDLPDYLKQQAG